MALHVKTRSTCSRLRVGAVVVRDRIIIGTGYNGSLPGEPHCDDVGCKLEKGRCVRTSHAERNALAQCNKMGISTMDACIYVTHFPCLDCMKQIIQSGIKRIVYLDDYNNHAYALELAVNARIDVLQITEPMQVPFS